VKSRRHILAFLAAFVFVLPVVNGIRAQNSQPLVEGVEVVGNRRLTWKDILSHIKTRPGERFSGEQCERDLNALFELGLFDKLRTRVITETGVRGGVVVIFEVVELPIVSDIKIANLRGIDEPVVLRRFQEKDVNLVKGGVYDPVKITAAQRVLKEILEARGWPDAVVKIEQQTPSAMYTSITFSITYEE
jgi:outer membrane protein assembly factor BamA